MKLQLPIGTDSFPILRQRGRYYVDKTQFISQLLDWGADSVLITRPRRFGKSLNLSTLRTFLEKTDEDRSWMFEDLSVWQDTHAREHFQRYPVVYLNFKDTKAGNWPLVWGLLQDTIKDAFVYHGYLSVSDKVTDADRQAFQRIYDGTAPDQSYHKTLPLLSRMLHAHHGEPVVLLIDEYDAPIHAGLTGGFAQEVVGFFRNFLGAGFKSNDHLFRGVLTGVLRIAKESIFSELNNVDVLTVLTPEFADCCGFTEREVARVAQDFGLSDQGKELADWYNGYRFGEHVIYNPWSVLNYLDKPSRGLMAYWVQSGSDDVLREVVLTKGFDMLADMETLLDGGSVTKLVTEHVAPRNLDSDEQAVWSLLLMSGYLTVSSARLLGDEYEAQLRIPNREVRTAFRRSVLSWFKQGLGSDRTVRQLQRAMLEGDEEAFGVLLQQVVEATLSPRDLAQSKVVPPEKVFQAFILGVLVSLERDYWVKSEEESGFGRCDVLVTPRQADKPAAVLEFKRPKDNSQQALERALTDALEQIEQRHYVARLQEAGASSIVRWGVAFDGKHVWVRRG